MIHRLALPQCGVMETVAVVLMVLGLIGVGSALVVLVRLRGQLERLGEQVDRVARRVEALPPDLSRVFGNRDRHIISVELLNLFELAHRETWVARPLSVLTPRLVARHHPPRPGRPGAGEPGRVRRRGGREVAPCPLQDHERPGLILAAAACPPRS
jgi:hypothetical protein